MADEAKARGNAAFSAGRFEEAVEHFTDAIKLAPDNHVLYRCARQPRALQVRPTTTCSTGAPDNHVLYRCVLPAPSPLTRSPHLLAPHLAVF
ncbi:unnamed protein product, partial [Closterium sp. Naga37s-1]